MRGHTVFCDWLLSRHCMSLKTDFPHIAWYIMLFVLWELNSITIAPICKIINWHILFGKQQICCTSVQVCNSSTSTPLRKWLETVKNVLNISRNWKSWHFFKLLQNLSLDSPPGGSDCFVNHMLQIENNFTCPATFKIPY